MLLTELTALLQNLVGHPVESKTIAGNSIWLWFDKDKTQGIYIDPPWRVLSETEIVGTSADFPWDRDESESEAEHRARFENACAATDAIQGSTLINLCVDNKTTDIRLVFESGLELCSFTVWRKEENWLFADYREKKRFCVSLEGVSIEPINA